MIEWKDSTSYSRNDVDKNKRIPTSWSTKAGPLRITVHRHMHYAPDEWLLSTIGIWFDKQPLVSKDIEEAKKEALTLIRTALRSALEVIDAK